MIGQLEEIVARALVGLDDLLGLQRAVRKGRMACEYSRARSAPASRREEFAWEHQVVAFAAPGQALSNENVLAFLGDISTIQIMHISVAATSRCGIER